jgi:hypothetical protein
MTAQQLDALVASFLTMQPAKNSAARPETSPVATT